MQKVKKFLRNHKHGLIFLYVFLYFPWFSWLEKHITTNFHIIHMPLDDMIPFCEFFVIPYFLWFAYIIATAVFFFFADAKEFIRLCIFLGVGMTLFLVISTLYPNGHCLRPEVFPRDNIFTDMVRHLYSTDTPTNLFPSIHVYNSIAACVAIFYSKHVKRKGTKAAALVLTILIILSTMFIKQHSVFDVLTAFALAAIMWLFLYSPLVKYFRFLRRTDV